MAYEGGFQQGLANRVEIPSMKDQLTYYDKRMTAEREAQKQRDFVAGQARQKAKQQLIRDTKAEFKSAADPTFKATGIFDIDVLGREMASIAQDQLTTNQYAFDQGLIDQQQYRNFNQNLNTDVAKLEEGMTAAAGFVDAKESLEQQGKGSFINNLKQEIAVNTMKNIKQEAMPDGHVRLVTLQQDGRELSFLPEQMTTMFKAEAGVGDLDAEVDDIVKNAGSYEYILKDKSGKLIKYTEGPGKTTERLKGFWETRVNAMSDYDVIDGLQRVGLVVEDERVRSGDQIVINANNLLEVASDPKKIEEYRDMLQDELALRTNNKLAFMQSTRKGMPTDGSGSGSGKDALVSTAKVLAKDAKDGYGDRLQIVPRDLRGLAATGLTFDDAFIRTALGDIQRTTIQQTGMGPLISGPEAIKNAKIIGANQFIDSGIMQVEFQYDYDIQDPNDPEGDKTITKTNVVKLDYKDLEDINKFRGGFNMPLIESKDFDATRQARVQKSSAPAKRMAKYN
jgi:hypothetical protein